MDDSHASEFPHGCRNHKQHHRPSHLGFIQTSVALCIITGCVRAAPAPKIIPGAHEVAALSIQQASPMLQERQQFGASTQKLGDDLKPKAVQAPARSSALLDSTSKVYMGRMMRRERMKSEPEGVAAKPAKVRPSKEVAVQPLGTLLQTQARSLKRISGPSPQSSETTGGQRNSDLHRVSLHEIDDQATTKDRSIAKNAGAKVANRQISKEPPRVRNVRRADAGILEDAPRANGNQHGGKVQSATLTAKNVAFSSMLDHRAAQGPLAPAVEPAQPAAQGQLSPAAVAPNAAPATVTAAPTNPPTTTTASPTVAVAVVPAPVVVRSQEGAKSTLIVAFLCGCAATCGCTCLLWWLATTFMGNRNNSLESRMTESEEPGTPSTFYRRRTTNLLGNPENTDADDTTNGARCSGGSETESKKNGAKKPG